MGSRWPRWPTTSTVACTPPRPSWLAPELPCVASIERRRAVTLDPLEALRLPIVPIGPRLEFADALLDRMLESGAVARIAPIARASIRYFVDDLEAAVEFYCRLLDFEEELRPSPAFAMLYRGDLRLLLSVPSASHALPDGTLPEPGGWNRISLRVTNLDATVTALRA